jgi:hypothetical protein
MVIKVFALAVAIAPRPRPAIMAALKTIFFADMGFLRNFNCLFTTQLLFCARVRPAALPCSGSNGSGKTSRTRVENNLPIQGVGCTNY